MTSKQEFILGEFSRTLDDRFRLSLPPEIADPLLSLGSDCVLAKQRAGCLSLWSAAGWNARHQAGVELVQAKMRAGKLEGRLEDVQQLGRLLSTRHTSVQLAARGRFLIPEGFREFLGVEAGGEVMVIGAAVCIEIWKPQVWLAYLEQSMPQFQTLFDQLSS